MIQRPSSLSSHTTSHMRSMPLSMRQSSSISESDTTVNNSSTHDTDTSTNTNTNHDIITDK